MLMLVEAPVWLGELVNAIWTVFVNAVAFVPGVKNRMRLLLPAPSPGTGLVVPGEAPTLKPVWFVGTVLEINVAVALVMFVTGRLEKLTCTAPPLASITEGDGQFVSKPACRWSAQAVGASVTIKTNKKTAQKRGRTRQR